MALFADMLGSSFDKVKGNPSVLAIGLLSLITIAVATAFVAVLFGSILASLGAGVFDLLTSPESVIEKIATSPLVILGAFWDNLWLLVGGGLFVALIAIIVSSVQSGAYLESARQARKGTVSLGSAFGKGIESLASVVSTQLAFGVVMLALLVGVAILSILPIIGTLVGMAAMAYVGLKFSLAIPIAVYEKKHWFQPLKESYDRTTGVALSIFAAFACPVVVSMLASAVFNIVPVVGVLLDFAFNLFLGAWISFTMAEYYFRQSKA